MSKEVPAVDLPVIVVLGTGGTIAGETDAAAPRQGYRPARLGVHELVAALPGTAGLRVETQQLAQVDSKDMSHAIWCRLAQAVTSHAARPEVQGVVITHGTDTLEETAYFLGRTVASSKPVVLTASMRPANALLSDGPQNLSDALWLAGQPGVSGVLVVMAGQVWGGRELRKSHPQSLQAFDAGDAGPLARLQGDRLLQWRAWPATRAVPFDQPSNQAESAATTAWPWVEIIHSHAGARGDAVRALVAAGVRGLVVAGTGNGTVHEALGAALLDAVEQGVAVRLASRCAAGALWLSPSEAVCAAASPPGGCGLAVLPIYDGLTPVQARIELLLELQARN